MKLQQLFFVLLMLFVIGCGKREHQMLPKDTQVALGRLIDSGDPSYDGCGWLIDIEGNVFSVDHLEEEFKQNGLQVRVYYQNTKYHYLCGRGAKPYSVIKIVKVEKR